MPLYEFQCEPCHTRFDVRASFQEKELGLDPICPHCQGRDVHQVLTTGMFIGKGDTLNPGGNTGMCGPNAGPGCCGQ